MLSQFWEDLQYRIYMNFIFENRYELVLLGIKITLLLTVVSFLVGTLVGVLLCMLKCSKRKWIKKVADLFVNMVIGLPAITLLMVFAYYILSGSGLTTVMIAICTFTLKAAASMSVMFEAAVLSVDEGETEAARTLGLSRSQAFTHIVMPQAIKQVLPLYKAQFVYTMQDTAVVGLIAVPDLTRTVTIITSRTMDPVLSLLVTSIVYLAIGALSNWLLHFAEKETHFKKSEVAICRSSQ